jgi:TRAP transporter 4TM/12TM fusion protein
MTAGDAPATPPATEDLARKAEELIEKYESPVRKLTGVASWATWALSIAISAYALYGALGTPNTYTFRVAHVALVLMATLLLYPRGRGDTRRVPVLDWALAVAVALSLLHVVRDVEDFIYRAMTPTAVDLAAGVLTIVLVLETTRRTTGRVLPLLSLACLAYAFVPGFLPGLWAHKGYDLERIVGHMTMTLEGVYGVPVGVSASFIILFIIYGAVLEQSGASKFFVDFAFAAMGRRPSGAGRTVTLASFLLGGPSGSGVATTVTVCSIAYPMLRKAGYHPDTAGAMFAAGGIGAVISPPILGAASFLIAEFLNVSYLEVIKMAVVPTLLYYLGIVLMIELDARRFGIRAIDMPGLDLGRLTRRYWFHLTSLVAIVAFMAMDLSAYYAITLSIGVAILFSWLRPDTRLTPRKLLAALEAGGRQVLSVAPTCAAAGLIVGTFTLTGLGLKFSDIIVSLAAGNLHLTLVYTAVVLLVLGLALPITASYLVAAVLTVPAMTTLGVPDFAAHMFVFYYAVLSEVSPPVALSPVAAAALTGGNPWRTMMITWKYTLPTFLVPFMFTMTPDGVGLLLRGGIGNVLLATATAVGATIALVWGVGGWVSARASALERTVLVIAGLLLFAADWRSDIAGFALFAAGISIHWIRTRRARRDARIGEHAIAP